MIFFCIMTGQIRIGCRSDSLAFNGLQVKLKNKMTWFPWCSILEAAAAAAKNRTTNTFILIQCVAGIYFLQNTLVGGGMAGWGKK